MRVSGSFDAAARALRRAGRRAAGRALRGGLTAALLLLSAGAAFAQCGPGAEPLADGTFCEATRFGLADPVAAARILDRLAALPEARRRNGALDLAGLCAVRSDPDLAAAYARNPEGTRGILETIFAAGGFAACRTDPVGILRILDRLETE